MKASAKTGAFALILGVGLGWGLHQPPVKVETRVKVKREVIVKHDKPEKITTVEPMPQACQQAIAQLDSILDPAKQSVAFSSQAQNLLAEYARGVAPPTEISVINKSLESLYEANNNLGTQVVRLMDAVELVQKTYNQCRKGG